MVSPHPNHRPVETLPPELRDASVPADALRWVESVTASRVDAVHRLDGASSAAVHRIDLATGASVVLRRYAWSGFLASEPDAPAREVEAIEFAGANGLPVPEVVAHDLDGSTIGDGVPAILMSLLPGTPVAVPDVRKLAEAAATIHAVSADRFGHEYFAWYEDEMTTPPPLTTRPLLWEQAIELWHTAVPDEPRAFIHRDFHPGNLLWEDGELTGIVDWANACRGPVGCDIAHCRANLRRLEGPKTAEAFVDAYESVTGDRLNPFWVMAGHLEHDHAHWTPERLAADEPDLERAVRQVLDG